MAEPESPKLGSQDIFDLIVVGSGPGGTHAAFQAAKLQKRVCIVEKHPKNIGGAWLHWGTIPSKTMRETLAAVQSIKFHVGSDWVQRILSTLSATRLRGRANEVSNQQQALMEKHLVNNGISIIHGYGTLEDRTSVRIVDGDRKSRIVSAPNIILATGSRPRRPVDVPFDGWRIVDSDELLLLQDLPKSIVVFGAGVIGCEFACIFAALGVETTIVDRRSRIMQTMDREIASELQRFMEILGVKFLLGQTFDRFEVNGPRVFCHLADKTLTSDLMFFAAGRASNVEHLGLEKLGIEVNDRGGISVNSHFQTSVPNIYAVGDVIGPPALAATSIAQGRQAACHAFSVGKMKFPEVFPIGIYTIPELSSVGATEEELVEKNVEYVVGRASYSEIARGYIRGDAHGMLKILVCKKTQKILGVHVVGDDACNLVHIGLAFMLRGGTAQELVNDMVFNYPTLAEAYRIAAFNALNKVFTNGRFIEDDKVLADSESIATKVAA